MAAAEPDDRGLEPQPAKAQGRGTAWLALGSFLALALAMLLADGDSMPLGLFEDWAGAAGEAVPTHEASPFRGEVPFSVHNTTHVLLPGSLYSHTLGGWAAYLAMGVVPMATNLLLAKLAFPGMPVRQLQIMELAHTTGMIAGGAFSSYPRFPVPTAYHGLNSRIAGISRKFFHKSPIPFVPSPVLAAVACAKFRRTRPLVDVISLFYVALDALPVIFNEAHVNERPTHNLRLLALSMSSLASRHRCYGAIMGLFYLGTGGPKLFPGFYRYWLWYGIYPSSTLSTLPWRLWFTRGADGGWHPNALAQLFGFTGGVMETLFAGLLLVPSRSNLWLRRLLPVVIHSSIILGRFDNGLSGWNMHFLISDTLHSLPPHSEAAWPELSAPAAGLVAVEAAYVLIYFLGHGSYHTGMSHHTGNFRMQWLLFQNDEAWGKFEDAMAKVTGKPACFLHPATCVHMFGHGTHYPTASFTAFLYALSGGTQVEEFLPVAITDEVEHYLEIPSNAEQELMLKSEREVRRDHRQEITAKLAGVFPDRNLTAGGSGGVFARPRAVYLGFASGASVWDDSFYEPMAADSIRAMAMWQPGECQFYELDRQRPWRRTRRLRVWDLSQMLPVSPRTLLDQLLGTSPKGWLVEERVLPVRRPFPGT